MNGNEERKARIISYVVVAAILVTMWFMLDMVLLTFIITFIFQNLTFKVKKRCDKVLPINLPVVPLLAIEYLLFAGLVVIFVSEILPTISSWAKILAAMFMDLDVSSLYASMDSHIIEFLEFIDISAMIRSIGAWFSASIATASANMVEFVVDLIIALVLAFAIITERGHLKAFGEKLAGSKAAYVYKYLMNFGQNFCETFGKVMKVQVIIALINSALSMIFLALMGFPGVPALGLMIFTLGLVPVAGVIVSLVPLSIIAISIGGFKKLFEVLVMIAVLHAIEAYILNPRLMSNMTRLPVCLTFIILLVGQHYMGVWGLLIGVPIFIFLMKMLEVDYAVVEKRSKRVKESFDTASEEAVSAAAARASAIIKEADDTKRPREE